MHGRFWEGGIFRGFLETLGVPYVGSGVTGSAVAMGKVAMKRAFRAEGVPVTRCTWFTGPQWRTVAGHRRRDHRVGRHEFGGLEAVAQAKGKLVEALPPDGMALLNSADP